jgi:hypothetical protein
LKRVFTLIFLFSLFSLSAKAEIAGYPFAGYGNETGFYGGALGYLRYKTAPADSVSEKNIFYLSSTYSEKKQFALVFEPTFYLKNGLYTINIDTQYQKWPTNFYGIGMNTDRDDSEKLTENVIELKVEVIREVTDKWEFGIGYNYIWHDIPKMTDDGSLIQGIIPGSEKFQNLGLGILVNFDDRNADSFPTRGNLFSMEITRFDEMLRSDYDFTNYVLDLRKYFPINSQNTLALQSYLSVMQGDVPYYQMNHLHNDMRAITSNLYIDKNEYVFRAEDRFFQWNTGIQQRLGLVFFTELGEVAADLEGFNLHDIQFNYGLGFRYSLFLEDRLNLRLDIGFGEVKANISMASGEVF